MESRGGGRVKYYKSLSVTFSADVWIDGEVKQRIEQDWKWETEGGGYARSLERKRIEWDGECNVEQRA